jgi:hypothetical protein
MANLSPVFGFQISALLLKPVNWPAEMTDPVPLEFT